MAWVGKRDVKRVKIMIAIIAERFLVISINRGYEKLNFEVR